MTKADRQKIFEKYGGRCAYCGCELQKGWHVDEIEPVRRNINKPGCIHPERFTLENQNPACASCNINKHSDSLEGFRSLIYGFINSLNRDSVQYKVAKRYGLVNETGIEVKFYFETLTQNKPS
jgi:hypothetical protein